MVKQARMRAAWTITLLAGMAIFAAPVAALPVQEPAQSAESVARVVHLVNIERTRAGLGPVTANPRLAAAAQTYADILASTDCFAHTCGPVPVLSDRIDLAGYSGWSRVGENIAGGYNTADEVVAGWMKSEGHRSNILNASFTEIGVGLASGGQMGTYWAQEFGVRRGGSLAFQPLIATEPAPAAETVTEEVVPAEGTALVEDPTAGSDTPVDETPVDEFMVVDPAAELPAAE